MGYLGVELGAPLSSVRAILLRFLAGLDLRIGAILTSYFVLVWRDEL